MKEIYLEAIKLFVMILAAVITRYVVPWLKAKTENETMQTLIDWASQAVLATEQIYGSGDGETKKRVVVEFIQKVLAQKGISLTDDEIDTIIEAAVKEMNENKAAVN